MRKTRPRRPGLIIQDLVTDSPVERTIEKLRGFIADQHGDISSIDAQHVRIKLGGDGSFFRRQGERQIRLSMDLQFEEDRASPTSDRRTTLREPRSTSKSTPSRGATAGMATHWLERETC